MTAQVTSQDLEYSLSNIINVTNRKKLVDILETIKGKKDLILENDLTPVLDLFAGIKVIRSAGVEKLFKLEPGQSPGTTQQCVYLIRPSLTSSQRVVEQITIDRREGRTLKQYTIIYVPRKSHLCEDLFEREGVHEYVRITEFPLGLVALDTDIFSMELSEFFPSFFLDGDFSWIPSVAFSLLQIESICGRISSVFGQGKGAKMILDLMSRLRDDSKKSSDVKNPQIGHLIIMDRDVDFASLLLTQVNFVGLLDETFSINSGKVTLGPEVTGQAEVKLPLNSVDKVFLEIRDKHFTSAFSYLKLRVEQLKTQHSERKDMKIGEIKKFVTNELAKVKQQHQSLSLLVSASQVMINKLEQFQGLLDTESGLLDGNNTRDCMNYIEDRINQQSPFYSSLILLCLMSICQDGLTEKDYKAFAKLLLQGYGHEHLVTLHALKKVGLLYPQQQKSLAASNQTTSRSGGNFLSGKVAAAFKSSAFRTSAKKLNLIPSEERYDFRVPPDPGYVFSGSYIPVICRIAEQALSRDGLQRIEEGLKLLPGPSVERKSHGLISGASTFPQVHASSKIALVFFLGGVTHAEISALRFLGAQKGYTFLIGATSIVRGASVLEQLAHVP